VLVALSIVVVLGVIVAFASSVFTRPAPAARGRQR
jgi:predicted RND superfamily exporter protein